MTDLKERPMGPRSLNSPRPPPASAEGKSGNLYEEKTRPFREEAWGGEQLGLLPGKQVRSQQSARRDYSKNEVGKGEGRQKNDTGSKP